MVYYNIEYYENGWRHELITEQYTEFFNEATKILEAKAPALVAPAFMTALPAFENGDVTTMTVGGVRFQCWESKS